MCGGVAVCPCRRGEQQVSDPPRGRYVVVLVRRSELPDHPGPKVSLGIERTADEVHAGRNRQAVVVKDRLGGIVDRGAVEGRSWGEGVPRHADVGAQLLSRWTPAPVVGDSHLPRAGGGEKREFDLVQTWADTTVGVLQRLA